MHIGHLTPLSLERERAYMEAFPNSLIQGNVDLTEKNVWWMDAYPGVKFSQ